MKSPSTIEQERKDDNYATVFTSQPFILEFSNIVQSTYKNNPLGFSLDLVQAMWNQREFVRTMYEKLIPTRKDPFKTIFPEAIKEYHDFLLLLKLQKSEDQNYILPAWTADMAWHIHMLHPSNYYNMTVSELGQVPNHVEQMINLGEMKDAAYRKISKKAARKNRTYNQLRSKFINKTIKKRMIITSIEDISFHGDTSIHNINGAPAKQNGTLNQNRSYVLAVKGHAGEKLKESSKQLFLPVIVNDKEASISPLVFSSPLTVHERILSNVAHTGYGYTGHKNICT
ncbi:hypothetical protein BDA99DRAFT_249446 [Phascolomyces articulosus]|uniref:Uncharacterized protein n=1 Tax=Phascolomyces articulosus TaxID=60185 RepID=A0AAD5KM03_9FUNG|nr:hypothetical protein BDA99DRAFT_249446 [Phascolomyces articulosus]